MVSPPIAPMLATAGDRLPAEDGNWAYEVKWDGVRTIAFAGPTFVLQSRNLRDVTASYPELSTMAALPAGTVVDGEIVAFDDDGRPSFQRLQSRMNVSGARTGRHVSRTPVAFVAFDVLYVDGDDVMGRPWTERRALLEGLVPPTGMLVPSAYREGGQRLLEATRGRRLEGVVAKRVDSTYVPGRRTPAWVKVKNLNRQEFVVGGWLPGAGSRGGTIGALVVGYYESGALRYAGRVGTGFTASELSVLAGLLAPAARADSPFDEPPVVPPGVKRSARWTHPELVVEVAFTEWTDSLTLRQPSYKGRRTDKDPTDVTRSG